MKTLSSSLMPVTLYFATSLTVIASGVLIMNWDKNKETAAPTALLILSLFFIYLLFCFSKFRILKTDNADYYLTNILTRKVEKIDATKIMGIKNKSLFDPLTKVLTYIDSSGRESNVWFTRKLGLL